MNGKEIIFLLTAEESFEIYHEIDSSTKVNFFQAGLFDDNNIKVYTSILELPHIGFVLTGDWLRNERYLILNKEAKLDVRAVPQKKGGIKYAVNQKTNFDSIIFKPSGIFQERIIVAGSVSTVWDTESALELYKMFSSKIKMKTRRIGSYFVGRKAEEKLKLGWRLVQDAGFSSEYDLKNAS